MTSKNLASFFVLQKLKLKTLLNCFPDLVNIRLDEVKLIDLDEVDLKTRLRKIRLEFEKPEMTQAEHQSMQEKFPNWQIVCPCKYS